MSTIVDLWNKDELPIKDGIYYAGGGCVELVVDAFPEPIIKKGEKFSLSDYLSRNPDDVTMIDAKGHIRLENGGYCEIGDGSYGSEGFIACLDEKNALKWVLYAEKSNPFVRVREVADRVVLVDSSAGFSLSINVDDPEGLELIDGER